MKNAAMLVSVLLLAGCASATMTGPKVTTDAEKREAAIQQQMLIKANEDDSARLWRVALPILVANADLCRNVNHSVPSWWVRFGNIYRWKEEARPAARAALGMDEALRVDRVAGSNKAGIQIGDRLIAINGTTIAPGKDALDSLRKLSHGVKTDQVVRFTLERGENVFTAETSPIDACDFRFGISTSPAINAFADGKEIRVTRGMMNFANDNELAIVLGHELAHNLRDHVAKQKGPVTVGAFFDALVGGFGIPTGGMFRKLAVNSQGRDFEREADYVGLYLTARAGVPIDDAPNFWRRMAVANPDSAKGGFLASHPPTAERFLALEATVAEIKAKLAQHEPLLPVASR